MNYFEEKNSYSLNFKYYFMPDSLPIIKKMTLMLAISKQIVTFA